MLFLKGCELILGCVFFLLLHGLCSTSGLTSKAVQLMSKFPLIDGHNDLALHLRILKNNRLSQFNMYNLTNTATDITRLKDGHVGGQVFAAYVLCMAQNMDAVRLTLEQIDVIRRMCTEYPELELVTTAADMRNSKKIACLISIEGGHSIDSSLPTLRMFYQLGVRSMTLTHNCNTPWSESSSLLYSFYKRNNSLTDFGKAVVNEMNRLGMLIDLSHTSWAMAQAVLHQSRAPVIFSHSSVYAICNHARNVPDDLLLLLKEKQGLIMVNFHSGFIACQEKANISILADHFDYLKKLIGARYIGIGGDYDGATKFPQGLEDVAKYPALIAELMRRDWSDEELSGVLRFNFLRVFESVEKVRDSLNNTHPSEVEIPFGEAANRCRLVLKDPRLQNKSVALVRVSGGAPFLSDSLFQRVFLLLCLLLL